MYATLRQLLFALDSETSHELAIAALAAYGSLPGKIHPIAGHPRRLLGLQFANPVGLAAGLDKDARAVEGLARLGFGFVEVGTVTPHGQPGNPRPRLFRLPQARALINRMGFNNLGVDAMARRLEALRRRGRLRDTRLGVNIGKNKDTPLDAAVTDYQRCMKAVYPHADYLTLNLSSPNTPGLRTLQSESALAPLLDGVRETQAGLEARHGRRVPLLLKIAPDLAPEDVGIVAGAVLRCGIDGVIATNTTIDRPGLDANGSGTKGTPPPVDAVADALANAVASEAGGLSGAPLHPLALATVARLRAALGPDVPVIGVGGIMSRADGEAMLAHGADLLQIYTGFIYRGPTLLRALAQL